MTEFSRGQKGKISEMGCYDPFRVTVDINHNSVGGSSVDVVCFGLDEHSKLSDDRYMIFFNQKTSPDFEITLDELGNKHIFLTNLTKLPNTIHRLIFAASIDGTGTMNQLKKSSLTIGTTEFNFSGFDFDQEKAMIIGEIYRRDGAWRFGAVGQGFSGGLPALLAHYGGSEEVKPEIQQKQTTPSKVTLTKAGQSHSISLVKGSGAPKKLVVKATWEDNGDGDSGNDDLDLRVGILLPDGKMKFVSAPDTPGSFDCSPFVKHLGDVTSVSSKEPATEIIEVNPDITLKYGGRIALVFSVYSAVGNGAVSIASLKPKMRMEYGDQVVECAFDFTHDKNSTNRNIYTYVIGTAIIDINTIKLEPSGQTSKPASENTPWLKWNGDRISLTIDGPVVFKGGGTSGHSIYKYS